MWFITLSGSVLFASGQSTLLPGASASLYNVAIALNKRPDQTITVEGHTDSVGSEEYNQALCVRRGESVYRYLVNRGVDPERFIVEGFGESRPIADNDTETGRAQNRRVEIVIR